MLSLLDEWNTYFRSLPWDVVKSVSEMALYFLAILAVFGCLLRLGTIRTIIRDFLEARGPIWDLRNMVTDLKTLEPVIKQLKDDVPLIFEKIDAIRQQAAEYQLETMSTRIEAAEDAPSVVSEPAQQGIAGIAATDDENWLRLREIWKRNTQRLEYVIDRIEDGRKRVVYDRMPRTNMDRIVNKLQGQGLITAAAANASRSLNEQFNSYRPRNRKVPDQVVGGMLVLDQLLERELVPYKRVADAVDSTEKVPPIYSPNVSPPPIALINQPNGTPPPTNFPGQARN